MAYYNVRLGKRQKKTSRELTELRIGNTKWDNIWKKVQFREAALFLLSMAKIDILRALC